MSTGTGMQGLRRRGVATFVAVLCLSLVWGCGASSDTTTEVAGRADSGSAATTESATTVLSGEAAALVGTWTNAEQITGFCSISRAIEVDGSSPSTTDSSTTNSGCTVGLLWREMRTLDIDASGQLTSTFVPPTDSEDSTSKGGSSGTCTGRVTVQGSDVQVSIEHCDPGQTSGNQVSIDQMKAPVVKLDDACLMVGTAFFAKTPGACDAQLHSAEEKFKGVGNAIENAN